VSSLLLVCVSSSFLSECDVQQTEYDAHTSDLFLLSSLQDFQSAPRIVPAKHTTVVADTVKHVVSRKDSVQ
jgi:hypothetical protein